MNLYEAEKLREAKYRIQFLVGWTMLIEEEIKEDQKRLSSLRKEMEQLNSFIKSKEGNISE